MDPSEQDQQGSPEATTRSSHFLNQRGTSHRPSTRLHVHSCSSSAHTHHVQGVESSKRCSYPCDSLGAAGQQFLQRPWPAQLLLHLLGACELGSNVRALHCPRSLQQQPCLPVLRHKENSHPVRKTKPKQQPPQCFSLVFPVQLLTSNLPSPFLPGRDGRWEQHSRIKQPCTHRFPSTSSNSAARLVHSHGLIPSSACPVLPPSDNTIIIVTCSLVVLAEDRNLSLGSRLNPLSRC